MKPASEQLLILFLVITLIPTSASTQPTAAVKVVSAVVSTDSKGPREIRLEFLITISSSASDVFLFYRPNSSTQFRRVRLKKNRQLNYTARTDYYRTLEYFVEITTDAGEKSTAFSPASPAVLATDNLPTETRVSKTSSILMVIVGVIAAIATTGIIVEKKP